MRQCDVYKIAALVTNGAKDKDILDHFKNHYDEDTIKGFIIRDKAPAASKPAPKGKGKSADPLG